MLHVKKQAHEKRIAFREGLKSGKLLRFPGSFSPLVSKAIEEKGFDGIYIGGAALSADLCLPDIGLTTMTEVCQRGRAILRATNLPSIVDIDTGFGEPMNVARTIRELEDLGFSGCHLEDQTNPKRCGHLDNKNLVSVTEHAKKIKVAVQAKIDANFLVIARTDARATEGLEGAISRAKAYVDAGAEMILPEALQNEKEFEAFRSAIDVPLLANMTEFGKSKLLTAEALEKLGYNLVIYPVSTLRLAMKAIDEGLSKLKADGTQEKILDKMQHRSELYDLLQYEDYVQYDQNIFNFKLDKGGES